MAVCIAVIGKDNSPKYISCLNPSLELQFHYKVHTSLDVVEEKLSSVGKPSGDIRELYLGLLYSTEEHKIFGYVTNTKIKLIIVIEASNVIRDNEIRTMFRKLHGIYTDIVCNPFYIPGDLITSNYTLFIQKDLYLDDVWAFYALNSQAHSTENSNDKINPLMETKFDETVHNIMTGNV